MRTWYEIEDSDAYLAARELLLRRCGSWAAANGHVMSPALAGALLDSRHFSSDGRLGYWTPAQVRRALLEAAKMNRDTPARRAASSKLSVAVGPLW